MPFKRDGIRAIALSGLAVLTAGTSQSAFAERPNILLIIGDDISPDFSCYGGDAKTPNIDRLAAGGVRFENAYVTASSCSPSRSSIITGRYPHNTGAPELHMDIPFGQFLFPRALKEAGYYCVQAGKWHMGDYARQAFDLVYEVSDKEDPAGSSRWVQTLRERPAERPFFLWLASHDAHRPWHEDTLTPEPDPALIGLFAGIPDTPAARKDVAGYLHEIQRFDHYVGYVVEELKKQGVFENTLIILLGDNGRPFPRSKTTLYDNGMKTPLIVHWPAGQVLAGAVSSSLVSAIDIAPAILEAAGLPIPPQVQGISLLPVCRQPDYRTREMIFGERNWHVQRACGRMVRKGNYLYIRNYTSHYYSFQMVDYDAGAYAELLRLKAEGALTAEQAEEFSTDMPEEMLFDVSKDPQQIHNLADHPEKKVILDALRKTLSVWQSETGDSIPDVNALTADRHDRQTFQRLYPGSRPPAGVMPGEAADAVNINVTGPF